MQTFLEEVNERIGGVPIQSCYHCRKCTAGCPIAFAMEYNPNQIIKMIQMGMRHFTFSIQGVTQLIHA